MGVRLLPFEVESSPAVAVRPADKPALWASRKVCKSRCSCRDWRSIYRNGSA